MPDPTDATVSTPAPAAAVAVTASGAPAAVPNPPASGASAPVGSGVQAGAGAPPTPAPVEPVYALTLPAGSALDAEDIKAETEFAKAHQLSPAVAQAILERKHQVVAEFQQAQQDGWKEQQAGFVKELASDPEFGGAKLEATRAAAQRVLQRFDLNGELTAHLKAIGVESHPPLIRFLARIGAASREDGSPPRADAPEAKPKSLGDLLYADKAPAA